MVACPSQVSQKANVNEYVFIKLRPEPRGLSSLLDVLYFKEKRFDYKIKLFCILNGQSKHGPWLGEG